MSRDLRDNGIKLALERVKLRGELEAQERKERRGEKLPIVLAVPIIAGLVVLIWLSFLCPEVRVWLKEFQTICAAFGAIAAALLAYHGSGAAAREARRKDRIDRNEKMISLMVRARLAAVEVEQGLKAAIIQMRHAMSDRPGYAVPEVNLPPIELMKGVLDGIGLLPTGERERIFTMAYGIAALHLDLERLLTLKANLTRHQDLVKGLGILLERSETILESANDLISSLMRY